MTTPATCETDGEGTCYCTVCLKPMGTRTIPATGHGWSVSHVTPAACTTAGSMEYVCRNDPEHTRAETIAALGHAWSDDSWTVTREPTTTEAGERTRYRLNGCGEKQTEPFPRRKAGTASMSMSGSDPTRSKRAITGPGRRMTFPVWTRAGGSIHTICNGDRPGFRL